MQNVLIKLDMTLLIKMRDCLKKKKKIWEKVDRIDNIMNQPPMKNI